MIRAERRRVHGLRRARQRSLADQNPFTQSGHFLFCQSAFSPSTHSKHYTIAGASPISERTYSMIEAKPCALPAKTLLHSFIFDKLETRTLMATCFVVRVIASKISPPPAPKTMMSNRMSREVNQGGRRLFPLASCTAYQRVVSRNSVVIIRGVITEEFGKNSSPRSSSRKTVSFQVF